MNTQLQMPDVVTDKVVDAVSAGKSLVHDAAHHVAERAPDLTSAVGRGARSSMDTVIDTVSDVAAELPGQVTKIATTLAALTPFVDATPATRRRARWLVRAAIVASIVSIACYLISNRRRHRAHDAPDIGRATEAPGTNQRHLASAGR